MRVAALRAGPGRVGARPGLGPRPQAPSVAPSPGGAGGTGRAQPHAAAINAARANGAVVEHPLPPPPALSTPGPALGSGEAAGSRHPLPEAHDTRACAHKEPPRGTKHSGAQALPRLRKPSAGSQAQFWGVFPPLFPYSLSPQSPVGKLQSPACPAPAPGRPPPPSAARRDGGSCGHTSMLKGQRGRSCLCAPPAPRRGARVSRGDSVPALDTQTR